MTTGRTGRLWAVALFGGALLATAVLSLTLSDTAKAQTAQGVDLTVRKSVSPKVVEVGEKQTFTIKVTNQGNRRANREARSSAS